MTSKFVIFCVKNWKVQWLAIFTLSVQLVLQKSRFIVHALVLSLVKKGEDIESLQKELTKLMGVPAQVNIQEISQPDLDARLVAEGIASQLERRVMFRRAMKRAVQNSMRSGAQGIKVELSGRLGGAEIARTEWYREGRVPLHTLRADIDYASVRAETTYGTIGVKVWIFRSEVLDGMNSAYNPVVEDKTRAPKRRGRSNRRNTDRG